MQFAEDVRCSTSCLVLPRHHIPILTTHCLPLLRSSNIANQQITDFCYFLGNFLHNCDALKESQASWCGIWSGSGNMETERRGCERVSTPGATLYRAPRALLQVFAISLPQFGPGVGLIPGITRPLRINLRKHDCGQVLLCDSFC